MTVFKDKFTNYLKNVHGLEVVRRRTAIINKYGDVVQDSKSKQFRTFGQEFAKVILDTLRETLPNDYFDDDNNILFKNFID